MLEAIQQFDAGMLLWIQEHLRVGFFNAPMVFISTLGNAGLCWIVLGLVLSIFPKTRKYGVLALLSLLICFLFNNILLKNLVSRPRPFTQIQELVMLIKCPSDHSFPSGHACSSFAVAGSLLWTMEKKWRAIRFSALALALLIAFSRLYVGVHYPTDVLVGAIIGLLGSGLVCHFCAEYYDRLERRLQKN